MNNNIMSRLKTCVTEEELKNLCTIIQAQIEQLYSDYYNRNISYHMFYRERGKLEDCKHYARRLCDVFEIERML